MVCDLGYQNAGQKIKQARLSGANEIPLSRMGLMRLLEATSLITQFQA
jgi:hypothetical protein